MSLINENKEIESNYSAEIYSAMKKAIKIGEDILSKDANEISASEVKEALTELSNKKEVLNLYLKEKVDELKTKIDEANNRLSGDLSNSELVNQLKLAVEEGNILINENSKNTLNIISATNKIEEALRNLEASLPDDGDHNETDDNGTNPGNEENNQESGKNSLGNINDKNEASIPETGGNNPVNRILFGVILLSVGASLIFNKKSKLVK
jgi:hyaluronoglucosaminidase